MRKTTDIRIRLEERQKERIKRLCSFYKTDISKKTIELWERELKRNKI